MAYNEYLADRIRKVFQDKNVYFEEKKMMGGLCYMVNEKMCAGVVNDKLMARINPEIYDEVIQKQGCKEMDFTGRPMRGFVFVEPDGVDFDDDLEQWIQLCLDYNPLAKSGKKKSTANQKQINNNKPMV